MAEEATNIFVGDNEIRIVVKLYSNFFDLAY